MDQILYSGNSEDVNGNRQPNPSFTTNSFLTEDKELLIKIFQSPLWQSLTFPGECVMLLDKKVIKRFNFAKQLSADFDYRFRPVSKKHVKQVFKLQNLFANNYIKLDVVVAEQLKQIIDYKRLSFDMSKNDFILINQQLKEAFNKLKIRIGFTQGDKLQIISQKNLEDVLTYMQQFKMCMNLVWVNLKQFFRDEFIYVYDQTSSTKINIFNGCECNVHVIDSDVIFDPNQIYTNVQIIRSRGVYLNGNSDTLIEDSNNVYINQSNNQGQRYISYDNCFIGKNVNGEILLQKEGHKQTLFLSEDNSIQFGQVQIYGDSQMVIHSGGCDGSDLRLMAVSGSNIIVGKNSCNYSDVKIQGSLIDGHLEVESDSIYGGSINMQSGCFNADQNQNPVCYIDTKTSCSFPQGIKYFWLIGYKRLDLLYGTKIAITNSVYRTDKEYYSLDNQQEVKKQCLLLSSPGESNSGWIRFVNDKWSEETTK